MIHTTNQYIGSYFQKHYVYLKRCRNLAIFLRVSLDKLEKRPMAQSSEVHCF